MQRSPAWRPLANGAALGAALIGAATLTGWWIDAPLLKSIWPGGATMKPNTGLCFLAAAAAILLLRPARAARLGAAAAAGVVLVIAALTAAAYLAGVDPGVDQWLIAVPPQARPVTGDPEVPGGRMALATALAMTLAAVSLLCSALGWQRRRASATARIAAGGVLVAGAIASAGYLFGIDFFHTWYAFGAVAVHTAVGLLLLGVGLLAAGRAGAWVAPPAGVDERIARLAAWLVVVAAAVTGIVGLAALQTQVRLALAESLLVARADRVAQLVTTIEHYNGRAALVADDRRLRAGLQSLGEGAAGAGLLAQVLEGYLPHGFNALTLHAGGAPIVAGESVAPAAALRVPLAGQDAAELLWRDGFHLRRRFILPAADGGAAQLDVEQPLPRLDAVLRRRLSGLGGWQTVDFILCHQGRDAFHCFPTALYDAPLRLPLASPEQPLLVQRAAAAGATFHDAFDYRGRRVLGAVGEVPDLGLTAVLKVDGQEIYRPFGRQFLLALALVAGLAGLGAALVRWWLRPMASALEQQVRERTAALEAVNRELHGEQARFRALIDASAQIVWTADADGTPDETPSWLAFTGQTVEQWRDGGWLDAVHPDDRRAAAAAWQAALASGAGFTIEFRLRRHDGAWRWSSGRAVPLRAEDGTLQGWVGMHIDIDEQRRAEAALRAAHADLERRVQERTRELVEANAAALAALKEKEVLLQEVHHRVKNNLQVMASLLNLQRHNADSPAVRLALQEAADRVGSIALLHEKLYLSPDLGRIDLGAYLGDLAERLLYQHARDDGRVRLEVTPGDVHLGIDQAIPCALIANELVTNALKYAFAGRAGGTIRIAVARAAGGEVCLHIADDGVGLPATVDPAHGATLGLRLVGTFVEQLDGQLRVDRRDGTSFEIRFPAAGLPAAEPVAAPAAAG